VAPRIELPPDQGDADFVIQIWDPLGANVYLSRPGLPLINQIVLGYADLKLQGEAWRAYGLQTADGVIEIAQPSRVRGALARAAALRVVVPLVLLLPVMIAAAAWIVRRGLLPLRLVTVEVQRRDVRSLSPLASANLPREIEPLVGELNRLLARLKQAFAAQSAFISDAAHELRSPLTALRLQLQLLERAPDEAARLQARTALGAAIERAIHLAEQLLALARSDPAETAGAFELIDLGAAVARGIADTNALAVARDTDLSLEAEPNLEVRGDADGLRTLVRNLVDNAVRYTPPGGCVRVNCRRAAGAVLLEVCDNGPGIAPADRTRVFDRFYRRAPAQESGTGLGLAIVKAIAERHSARISLADAPGGGLCIAVCFPVLS
jgi:two-component system OmpR family sensor kinase/two-component system sensor histidine kinase QseC